MKKTSDFSRLMGYAGRYRVFTYASWVLSAISALTALVPFLYIWMILRDVLAAAPDYAQAVNIPHYGWMAVLFAVLSYLIYIAALMCSHLSAFRVATNLRLAVSEHLAVLPLGFAENFGSGKLRKIIHESMQGALQNLAAVIAMRTNVGRMNEILDAPLQTGSEQLTNQGCDIVFDHVGFAYNPGETVLRDVSFTAKQGEVTALVGPSGGGKTTVSRLAARFWDYQKGIITVGGMEVSRIDPEKLMSLYSIVFQDVTLFDNTILENIRLGRKGATDEEVLAAAKLANCEEFAEKLPDKWHTNIGENGCALSGGERQRISIARAFLKDAPIILLDEATASLDVENETAIQEALSRLIKHKTVLIIAHRMRTVAGADKIVVLSDGVVAEQGAPDALYARNGQYTHMVDLQTESQRWAI